MYFLFFKKLLDLLNLDEGIDLQVLLRVQDFSYSGVGVGILVIAESNRVLDVAKGIRVLRFGK